jgi:polyhydroxyalkanoate synthesis regulator phasin
MVLIVGRENYGLGVINGMQKYIDELYNKGHIDDEQKRDFEDCLYQRK